jgi:hypothetical protein
MKSGCRGLAIGVSRLGRGCCNLTDLGLSMDADRFWCTGEFAGKGLRFRMLRPWSGMEILANDRFRRLRCGSDPTSREVPLTGGRAVDILQAVK